MSTAAVVAEMSTSYAQSGPPAFRTVRLHSLHSSRSGSPSSSLSRPATCRSAPRAPGGARRLRMLQRARPANCSWKCLRSTDTLLSTDRMPKGPSRYFKGDPKLFGSVFAQLRAGGAYLSALGSFPVAHVRDATRGTDTARKSAQAVRVYPSPVVLVDHSRGATSRRPRKRTCSPSISRTAP